MKPGIVVKIYNDPVTQKNLEGRARLIEKCNHSEIGCGHP